MKGTISASELASAVKAAQSIIASSIKIDAYRHVRLTAKGGKLEIEATSLDQHIALQIEASLSDGTALVDPARLLMALQSISGDATISTADRFMSVTGKGARSRLALLGDEAWAGIQRPAMENAFDVDAESLAAAFSTVTPAVSADASRCYLQGAHLRWVGNDLIAEAANGHNLIARQIIARRPAEWPDTSIIVPTEFMTAAAKIIKGEGATLSITRDRIIVSSPRGSLASKLIAGTFPDTDRAWDKEARPVLRADRKSLLDTMQMAERFCEASNDGRRAVIHNGEVIAAGGPGEMFRAAFEGEYVKDGTFCFQPRVLIVALSALESETVELTDGGKFPNTTSINGDGARVCVAMQVKPPAWWLRDQAAEREAA